MSLRLLPSLLVLLSSSLAAQTTWFVDGNAPGGGGTSWGTALSSLDTALALATAGDSVYVMWGFSYASTSTSGFSIPAGVQVFGGFTHPSQLSPAARVRIPGTGLLLAPTDLTGAIPTGGANYHVVNTMSGGEAIHTRLDGFNIHGGMATGPLILDTLGGGVLIAPSAAQTIDLVELNINENTALDGGGLYAKNAKLLMYRCRFNENWANQDGAGLYLSEVFLRADDCDIDTNKALRNGGGIFASQIEAPGGRPLVEVVNTLIHSNVAGVFGGGAYLHGSETASGKVAFNHCTISLNQTGLRGGGVFALTSTPVKAVSLIENSIVWSNVNPLGVDELAGRQTCRYSDVPYVDLGCFYQDPLFTIDPIFGGTFDLSPGSPCADAGNVSYSTNDPFDLDGDGIVFEPLPLDYGNRPRPLGAQVSMGAYER